MRWNAIVSNCSKNTVIGLLLIGLKDENPEVRRSAQAAAEEGGARIRRAEEELELTRAKLAAAEAGGAQTAHEWQRTVEERDFEVNRMRQEFEKASESASSNAALASEAASRLQTAETIVQDTRRSAAAAEERVKQLEANASKARSEAAAAAREREDSLREQLATAERRYERLATEAEQASANAERAMAERDHKIQSLEHSLTDLEAKSSQAVVAAQQAVASAEHARFNAEDAAASAAADAAATYMRLESSLSQAEQELRDIESSMESELRNYSSSSSSSAGGSAAMGRLIEAEDRMVELESLGQQLLDTINRQGMVPVVGAWRAPPRISNSGAVVTEQDAQRAVERADVMVDDMEMKAAKLWAQLESAGIDPSQHLR